MVMSLKIPIPVVKVERMDRLGILVRLRLLGEAMKKELMRNFTDWKIKPKVEVKIKIQTVGQGVTPAGAIGGNFGSVTVSLYSEDRLLYWMNYGVKGHLIKPTTAFSVGYAANQYTKTPRSQWKKRKRKAVLKILPFRLPVSTRILSPGNMQRARVLMTAKTGRKFWSYAMHAHWKGIKARRWDKFIIPLFRPYMIRIMEQVMKDLAKGVTVTWK